MVIIYIPDEKDFPIPNLLEVVELTRQKPETLTVIENCKCACKTVNGISVFARSIFIQNKNLYVASASAYMIHYNAEEEFNTAIFWLIKSKFYKPSIKIIEYYSRRSQKKEKTLSTYLSPVFHEVIQLPCGCIQYINDDILVYCLKNIVLSGHKKGPTISSVL